MGVLSDKIQSFIDSITNAITAMDDDVIEGKTYWKAGSVQQGCLSLMTDTDYSVDLSGDMANVNIAFSQKAYVTPASVISIPVEELRAMLATIEDPEDDEGEEEVLPPDADPEEPEEPEEPEAEPEE